MNKPATAPKITREGELRTTAQRLYWQGFKVTQIANDLNLPYGTVDSWKRRDEWDKASVVVKTEACIEARLMQIIAKPEKTDQDYKELEAISRILERTARIKKFAKSENEADLNPNIKKRQKGKKKPEEKNFLSEEDVENLVAAFDADLFGYQHTWKEARDLYRIRNVLKSRQIGATWYFAREALINAITTGDNQIFLSASKAQAHVFREYIVQFVKDVCDITLRGDPIKLWNGATLYFLGTNSRTAQSYHGHLYMDEYFWIPRFAEFQKVASGMSVHKKWTQTYFSTPSTVGHEAHPFWTGERLNKGRKKEARVEINVSHEALKAGRLCEDGHWRQIVTIEDAVDGGCDLFDIELLRLEYSDQDFENLFMCLFVDDHASFFSLAALQGCMVDSWTHWDDFDPFAARPFGDRIVWLGYDPSRFKDDASVMVIAPPLVEGGKYRCLEKLKWNGVDFSTQARSIELLCERYNVQHIGIDTSTIGLGVFELVQEFFPAALGISYSVETKNRLVLKAEQLISRKRLEYDTGWNDLTLSFLTIRRTATSSGRQTTFQASRTAETGHADIAWATMHALSAEGLTNIDSPNAGGVKASFIQMF